MFGDAIFPIRKHEYAVELKRKHSIGFVAAVSYKDALVEVDLAREPRYIEELQRSDRARPVVHGFYTGDQLRVIAEEAGGLAE